MTIIAAADGSALGNPGPAGWAWYVDDEHWHAGGWPHGTNNQGELMAVIDLLESTAGSGDDVHVLCDSQYVINAVTKWMPGWKRKGWRKADGAPVMNRELVQRLDTALTGRTVSFEWVKGHAGHRMNEAADERARAAATAYQSRSDVPTGPGWPGSPPAATARVGTDAVVPEPDETTVLRLERRLLTPAARADASELSTLLHPEFEEIGESGRLWDRDTVIQSLTAEPVDGGTIEPLSTTRVASDAILLAYRAASIAGDSLRSSLWLRIDGRWRLRFHQGTRA